MADMILKTILIDCDGVLTDGALTIDQYGEKMFKKFYTRDVRAIRELVYNGYEVVIVTADDWPGIHHFAEKVGADVYVCRDKGNLPYENYIAIGDDCWDIPMLKKAALAFTPIDADTSVLFLKNVQVLNAMGGRGVIAEFNKILLKKQK